jgi:hypothetical protein
MQLIRDELPMKSDLGPREVVARGDRGAPVY